MLGIGLVGDHPFRAGAGAGGDIGFGRVERGEAPVGGPVQVEAAFGMGAVYAVTVERKAWTLVAVDAQNGTRRWAVPVIAERDWKKSGQATIFAGVAFVGRLVVATVQDLGLSLEQSGLIAVDSEVVRWCRPLLKPAAAVTSGERLFTASYDSVLHELDPTTGKTLWSVPTPGPVNMLNIGSTLLVATIGHRTMTFPLLRR